MIKKLLILIAQESSYPPPAADFARAQILALPIIARYGVYVLATLFYCHFRLVGTLPTTRWHHSPLLPCRDFILLCDSLLAFYYYGKESPTR